MRRILIGIALVGATALVARALAPGLGERCGAACRGMLDRMPEDMPPKRMMRSLDVIEERTGRILSLLEERDETTGLGGAGTLIG